MTTAIYIHWPNFFASNRGYEYALSLAAISLSLLISGGGMLSIDRAITGGGRR
jgi:putative oxidoreductase